MRGRKLVIPVQKNRKEGKLAGGSLVGKDDRAARKLKRMKKRMSRKGRRK